MVTREDKSNHPVLPQLNDNPTIEGFDRAGVWKQRGVKELSTLSDDLKVEKVGINLNSIPDMWARPLLFEMALYDIPSADGKYLGHLLHKRILAEWRGLMAMLALKEAAHITAFRAEEFTIPTDEAMLETAPAFLRAAANLLPTGTIDPQTSWHKFYILLYNTRPIGMTSPTTLVVTATDYFSALDRTIVPWFDGKLLLDPTKKIVDDTIGNVKNPVLTDDFISDKQKELLAGWLKALSDAIHARGIAGNANALLSLIKEYVTDLGFDIDSVEAVQLSTTSFGMNQGVYTLIDKPAHSLQIPPDRSDVKLKSSRTRPIAPAKPILVVDREIAIQWDKQPAQISVGDRMTLQTAIPTTGFSDTPPDQKNVLGNTTITGAEVWSPKWFFKKQLYVIRRENAFDKVVGIAGSNVKIGEQTVTPILPLDKVLVDHLTVEDLASRVSFEQQPNGILVKLRLKLSGSDTEFVASRLYRRDRDEIKPLENVPVLEVWPNFKADAWKANYTYYDAKAIAETFEAKPYAPGTQSEEGIISDKQRITRTDHYPEAVLCTVKGVQGDIGFLLIQQPSGEKAITSYGANNYKVGVDFGASGTNIFYRVGNDNPQPFKIEERYVSVTKSELKSIIYDNCLPAGTESTPFLSIFKRFPNAPQQNLEPLLHSIIYFPSGRLELDSSITYNLKWSNQRSDTEKVQAFLKQIALQVAAEAVNAGARSIDWYFSFPTAFDKTRLSDLEANWQQVITFCAKLTGVTSTKHQVQKETESIAAAKYFKDKNGHNAATDIGAVFIDVGGSTSDIAIWQRSLLWQTSILLAGRDIFLDFLRDNLDLLKEINADVDLEPLEKAKNSPRPEDLYAQIDHLLRRDGETLLNSLHHPAAKKEKMRQVVAVGISGIFYYTGLIFKHLISKGKYDNKEIPSFFMGGNGSQMFRWLTSGLPYDSSAQANSIFKTAFFRASGLSGDSLKIEISKQPKAEAAFGLICDTTITAAATATGKQFLTGEKFIQSGVTKEWDTPLDGDNLPTNMSVPAKLENLKDFIDAYNEGARGAGFIEIQGANLLPDVRRSLSNNINSGEPIFILELKHLLAELRS